MKSAKVLTSVTNNAPQILTALRAQMVAENPSFENRLPQVTQDNIREFGTAVLDYQPTQNAFVDTLVNLIGRVWITYRLFTNPMRVLKRVFWNTATLWSLFTPILQKHTSLTRHRLKKNG